MIMNQHAHRNQSASPPLARCLVAVTRPAGRADAIAELLVEAGARVLVVPAIELESLIDPRGREFERELELLHVSQGWLILPSPSAVEFFLSATVRISGLHGLMAGIRFATIGRAGAELLHEAGFKHVFLPPHPLGESLAAKLPAVAGQPVLVAGSAISREELGAGLRARGIAVRHLSLYRPVPSPANLVRLADMLAAPIDPRLPLRLVLVSSPSAVDAIAEAIEPPQDWLAAGWLAIGPTTMDRLRRLLPPPALAAEAANPAPDAILEAAVQLAERLSR